jgi:hypothetical protein
VQVEDELSTSSDATISKLCAEFASLRNVR